MAILLREPRNIDGQEFKDLKIFKSENPLITKQDEKKALELDRYIRLFFSRLITESKRNGLFQLKNKAGVIELWYFVGKKLDFIDDPELVHPSDKKFIWRALWQHAADLAPGEMKSRAGTIRDHFLYCYRLAKYEREFVLSSGTWSNWQEFFDSPVLSDKVVLDWFEEKIPTIKKKGLRNWLRDFIKLVRNQFQNIDLAFLSKDEIREKLDTIFASFIESQIDN
jgi:hypothetical protein